MLADLFKKYNTWVYNLIVIFIKIIGQVSNFNIAKPLYGLPQNRETNLCEFGDDSFMIHLFGQRGTLQSLQGQPNKTTVPIPKTAIFLEAKTAALYSKPTSSLLTIYKTISHPHSW